MEIVAFWAPPAILAAIFCGALVLRRHLRWTPHPVIPVPTAEEQVWLRELDALQLEARHVFC